MKRIRKGQAAMEFLMTYGWAILVVLAAIGALAYFGVLSPTRFLPEQCTLEPPISCLEASADTNGIHLVLQNNAGYDIEVSSVNATGDCAFKNTDMSGKIVQNGKKVNDGDDVIDLDCTLESGKRVTADIDVTFKQSGGELTHHSTGTYQGKVQ